MRFREDVSANLLTFIKKVLNVSANLLLFALDGAKSVLGGVLRMQRRSYKHL